MATSSNLLDPGTGESNLARYIKECSLMKKNYDSVQKAFDSCNESKTESSVWGYIFVGLLAGTAGFMMGNGRK